MKLEPNDDLNTLRRIQANHRRSSYSQPDVAKAAPVEFGDREIQMYMLNPQAPSSNLKALYDAIRHQMALDGCD